MFVDFINESHEIKFMFVDIIGIEIGDKSIETVPGCVFLVVRFI